ncbi:MAG: DUF1554 domain-containing protein [Myxococcota bacterium]
MTAVFNSVDYTREGANNAVVLVSLNRAPSAITTVSVVVSNPSAASAIPYQLEFSPGGQQEDMVVLQSQDNNTFEGTQPYSVTLEVIAGDPCYVGQVAVLETEDRDNDFRIFTTGPVTPGQGEFQGVSGADDICQRAANDRGISSTFKAMLVDGTNRVANTDPWGQSGAMDWVLQNNSHYYRNDDLQLAFSTTGLALVQFIYNENLANPLSPTTEGAYWTGMGDHWVTEGDHCSRWTSGQGNGRVGNLKAEDMSAINDGPQPCDGAHHLVCVEQPTP